MVKLHTLVSFRKSSFLKTKNWLAKRDVDKVVKLHYVHSASILLFAAFINMIHNVVRDSVIIIQKVCEFNYPTKIKELLRWGLCCTYLRYGVKSVRQKSLTLYELNRVPEILKLFKCPSPELEQGMSQLIENFDPEDPYWRVSSLPLDQYLSPSKYICYHPVK